MGTPLYAAPEQEKGIGYVTPGADLYALGCVLFEMLTGKRYKRVKPGTRASSLRADVPGWLDEVVGRALADEVWSRWESAAEMAAALNAEAPEAAERKRQAREAEATRQAELKRQPEAAEPDEDRRCRQRCRGEGDAPEPKVHLPEEGEQRDVDSA